MNNFDYIMILFFVTISTIGVFYLLYETFKHKMTRKCKAMKSDKMDISQSLMISEGRELSIADSKNSIGEGKMCVTGSRIPEKQLLGAREFYTNQQEKRYGIITEKVRV